MCLNDYGVCAFRKMFCCIYNRHWTHKMRRFLGPVAYMCGNTIFPKSDIFDKGDLYQTLITNILETMAGRLGYDIVKNWIILQDIACLDSPRRTTGSFMISTVKSVESLEFSMKIYDNFHSNNGAVVKISSNIIIN